MERFLDFQLRKEVKLLPFSLCQSFRGVAVTLLSLFSSVYIYKTLVGLTDQPKIGLLAIAIYFLSVYGFKFISNLFAEELSLRFGLKKQMYFGLFFAAICLSILSFSLKWPLLLFLAAPFWGVSTGFFWFGSHGMMVKIGRDGAFGKQVGMIGLMSTVFLLGAPLAGGILIKLGGYKALFGAALVLIFLAALSIKPLKEEKTRHDTNIGEVLQLFRAHKRPFLAYIGDNIAAVSYSVMIPLYLFLILEKELAIGEFFSLSMVVVAVIIFLIGRWADVRGKRGLIVYGSFFQALVWLTRIFTRGIGALFALDILDRITDGMVGIPLSVMSYEKALEDHSTGRAILFRELAVTIGGMITCTLLIVWALLGLGFEAIFLLAALASFLPILIVRPKKK